MIRALLGLFMMRSIERDRPLPGWLGVLVRRSSRLADLERRLRSAHARLSTSTAGVIGAAPAGLADRTLAALGSRPRIAGARLAGAYEGRRWLGATIALIGTVAAAAAIVLIAMPTTPAADPAGPAHEAPPTLLSVLRAPEEIPPDPLNGLVAEAQRLREDTRAAADFVLSRIRILSVQSGG